MDRRSRVCAALAVALAVASGVALAKKPLAGIPLQWRQTTTLAELGAVDLTGLDKAAVSLAPLVDTRTVSDPQLVGENREKEDKNVVLPVTTKDDVAAFCTTNLAAMMKKVGLPMTDSGATVTVSGELTSFFVTEKETYVGDVALKVKVVDARGETLWNGTASGTSKRWGRSYNAENYLEVLSDSLVEALFSLLRNQRFLDALGGKGGAR